MGADLFESYVGSMIGAMVLAATAGEKSLVFLPLFLAAAGIIVSIFGTFFVKTKREKSSNSTKYWSIWLRSCNDRG